MVLMKDAGKLAGELTLDLVFALLLLCCCHVDSHGPLLLGSCPTVIMILGSLLQAEFTVLLW